MSLKVKQFNEALAQSQRSAVIEQLRAHSDLTIDDLVRLRSSQESIGDITLGELVSGKPGGGRRRVRASRSAPLGRRGGRKKKVDTRSAEGREEFDAAVLEAVKGDGGPVTAEQVMLVVGGSGDQMRRSLKRLVAAKQVKRSGRGRGTTYQAR